MLTAALAYVVIVLAGCVAVAALCAVAGRS